MSYEPIPRAAKRQMAWIVLAWRSAMIVGNRAPFVEQAWQWHSNPRAGDLCVEVSTLARLLHHDPALEDDRWDGQFAPFVATEVRTITPDGWDDEPFDETYHIVENPDGTTFEWTNAELAAVPQGFMGDWT